MYVKWAALPSVPGNASFWSLLVVVVWPGSLCCPEGVSTMSSPSTQQQREGHVVIPPFCQMTLNRELWPLPALGEGPGVFTAG